MVVWNAGTQVNGAGTYVLELGNDSVLRVKKNGATVWSSPNAPINPTPPANAYALFNWMYMFYNPYMATNISSPLGWRTRNSLLEYHCGIDITTGVTSGIAGYPVYSTTRGVVFYSGWNDFGGGNTVKIRTTCIDPYTGQDIIVKYYHLQQLPVVPNGVLVHDRNSPTLLGYVGNTSNTPMGYHLHFEVTNDGSEIVTGSQSNTINPELFFPNVAFTRLP